MDKSDLILIHEVLATLWNDRSMTLDDALDQHDIAEQHFRDVLQQLLESIG